MPATRSKKPAKTEPGWVQPSAEKIRVAAGALIHLVDEHLPQRFYRGERYWRMYCATMIVRMVDTVESMLVLMDADKPVDGAILLRALYEEVVGFLWIAAKPEERVGRWVEGARFWDRKMHMEALRYDMKVLSRKELAQTKDAREMPDLAQRASQVDKYWGGRLDGFRPSTGGAEGILTMRGLYESIYRFTSRAAHAQLNALDPYVDVQKYPRVVTRPAPTTQSIFWPLSVPLFAQALLVCHDQLGWPDPERVKAANDAMYVPDVDAPSFEPREAKGDPNPFTGRT
jgi:hypothetical protein